MLITTEWSTPQQLEKGKNIRIRTSPHKIYIRLIKASGESITKTSSPSNRELLFTASEIGITTPATISFKTEALEGHLEWEYC
jgi:hypothetical protein